MAVKNGVRAIFPQVYSTFTSVVVHMQAVVVFVVEVAGVVVVAADDVAKSKVGVQI
jgi:hypothetical protein